jgi:hypothetical protein
MCFFSYFGVDWNCAVCFVETLCCSIDDNAGDVKLQEIPSKRLSDELTKRTHHSGAVDGHANGSNSDVTTTTTRIAESAHVRHSSGIVVTALGASDVDAGDDADEAARAARIAALDETPIGFLAAWLIPGVAVYAVTNAFTKFVSYALFLWLPFFLHGFGSSEATSDLLATLFDVGGVVGGITIGFLSDFALRHAVGRSLVILPVLLCSTVTLSLWASARTVFVYSLLMLFAGVFSNSAYNLINSTIAADLGSHP